jgi:nucleotide-binding universal stress UspA family protein
MKFVVAVDGTEGSRRALERAIAWGAPADADVTVVYAVDPAVQSEGGEEPVADIADAGDRLVVEDEGDAERRGERALEEAATVAADHGVEVATELLYGPPAAAVAEYANEAGVDGVFVGHRALSERQEEVLGSVAKGLIERTDVPVTVVP